MPKHVRNILFLILTLLKISYSKGENIVNKALPIHSQQDTLSNPSNNKNTIETGKIFVKKGTIVSYKSSNPEKLEIVVIDKKNKESDSEKANLKKEKTLKKEVKITKVLSNNKPKAIQKTFYLPYDLPSIHNSNNLKNVAVVSSQDTVRKVATKTKLIVEEIVFTQEKNTKTNTTSLSIIQIGIYKTYGIRPPPYLG